MAPRDARREQRQASGHESSPVFHVSGGGHGSPPRVARRQRGMSGGDHGSPPRAARRVAPQQQRPWTWASSNGSSPCDASREHTSTAQQPSGARSAGWRTQFTLSLSWLTTASTVHTSSSTTMRFELAVLRPRAHKPLRWDERYTSFSGRAGFLELAHLVVGGLPQMDNALLTAMVDRWRPETHTFHLPCGEMTVTMEDIAMILGLPLEGLPVTGIIESDNGRDMVEQHIGLRPPEPPEGVRDRKTSGVNSAWLKANFNHCPPGADEATVERHARVWLWHLVNGFLFPDASGNTVSWVVLPILGEAWENIRVYSWGSAVLAWLYRQLCDACRRTSEDSNVGGCVYLLQVWIWERISVGQPHRGQVEPWPHQDAGPTVAYLWKQAVEVRGPPARRYKSYINELDYITQTQVEWHPYVELLDHFECSQMCLRDTTLWRATIPLIFFYVVEMHLPQRTMRQFARAQLTLLLSYPLHKLCISLKGRSGTRRKIGGLPMLGGFKSGRTLGEGLTPTMGHSGVQDHIKSTSDDPSSDYDDDIVDEYDVMTRQGTQPERAPLQDYMAQQLARLANEARVAMSHASSSANNGGALRQFAERVRRSYHRMAMKLNCLSSADVAYAQGVGGTVSGSSRRTPVFQGTSGMERTPSRTRSAPATAARASTSHGKAPASSESTEEGGDNGTSNNNDPPYGEELPMSQMFDAPPFTQSQGQSSQATPTERELRLRRRARDRLDLGSGNILPTEPGRERRARDVFSPPDQRRRRR